MGTDEKTQATKSTELKKRIEHLARSGSFQEAEQVRDELMAAHPMAIDCIVATAETIEKEKFKRLDNDYLAAWSDLYDELGDEEKTRLFYSLKQARLKAGKLLVAQGRTNDNLFFIEAGTVTLFYRKKQKNFAVRQLKQGDILGEDSFFGISLCPFSAVTKDETTIRYISRKQAEQWRVDHPPLYTKLADYCKTYGIGDVTAEQKSSGRREYRRYPVAGSATAYILDEKRQRTAEYFRGELIDMSRSGACFSIRCSRKEDARKLLLKAIEISIVFDDQKQRKYELSGTIVRLSYHLHNDYFVHVKLDKVISIDQFKTFPCDWSSEEKF